MSIVRMKRLRLIALNEQKDDLLAGLLHVGCVEVTEPEGKLSDPEWAALVHKDTTSIMDVKQRAGALTSALDALKKYAGVKSGLFEVRETLTEKTFFSEEKLAKAEDTAEKINEEVREISQNYAKENRLKAQGASLIPWKDLDWPLSRTETDCTDITIGSIPAQVDLTALQGKLSEAAPESDLMLVHEDKEQKYLFLVSHKSETEDAINVLREVSFSVSHFKEAAGTAKESLAVLDEETRKLEQERNEHIAKIAALKGERENLKCSLDRMNQEVNKQLAREKFLANDTVFFMEGWVASTGENRLVKELEKYCCAYELSDPEPEEKPPVLLQNPWWQVPMNMVVEMYSLPDYRGVDPVPLIWPFYVLFFGLMFADVGYGLLMFIVAYIIKKKYNPKGGMGYICGLGILLGLSTAICGIFTGGYFGDLITVFCENFLGIEFSMPCLINPLEDPMTVLIISIVLGIIQMFFGQCIRIWMAKRDGELMDALLDIVPWWIFLGGVAVIAFTGNSVMIWTGVVVLICTQGRHKKSLIGKIVGGVTSLYDVTSWLGDILSYSRIMALMLATTVIASVVNLMASLPGNIIAFVLICIFGHVFNLGINLIGTYVHAARLQYLEFFGKFYKDGGVPFRPLAYNTKYVDVTAEEEK